MGLDGRRRKASVGTEGEVIGGWCCCCQRVVVGVVQRRGVPVLGRWTVRSMRGAGARGADVEGGDGWGMGDRESEKEKERRAAVPELDG